MTAPQSPEAKSLAYAEGLGLNSVYETALKSRQELDTKLNDLHVTKGERRRLEALRVDLEMEIAERERGVNPDMPVAAMDRHMKVVLSNDGEVRETKDQIGYLTGQIELLEYDVDLLNTDIKIAVARLHELGGYFQFMAVLKGISESRKSKRDEKDPW